MSKVDPAKVKIVWQDAISYKLGDKIPHSVSVFETTGSLVREDDSHVVIGEPSTIHTETGRNYPDKQPTFFLIPKVLIIKKS